MNYGGTFSGAAQGASVGSAFGPTGAVVGAALGAVAGFMGDKSQAKAERRLRRAIQLKYREQFRVMTKERAQLLGTQRVGYAAANVMTDVGSAATVQDETKFEFAHAWRLAQQAKKQEMQQVSTGSNFWQAGLSALDAAGSIYSAFNKK